MVQNHRDVERLRRIAIEKLNRSGTADDRALVGIVCRAKANGRWGLGDRVNMGPFETEAEFWTELFHEAGHKHLGVGGEMREEEMCHHFSRRTCTRLGLPYSLELEASSRAVRLIYEKWYREGEFDCDALEAISPSHRAVLGVTNREEE